jgi:hypothetical protein
MTYWRATVERPDGNGGWVVVGVFGTMDSPADGSGRYISGATALEAAHLVLSHVWPVDLAEYLRRDELDRWKDRIKANTGIADHRITVDVDPARRWSVDSDQPVPEPLTITVGELRLAEVRAQAAAYAEAQAKLKALNEQVRAARADVKHGKWRIEEAAQVATRAGVPEPDVAKASRPPRQPRKKR